MVSDTRGRHDGALMRPKLVLALFPLLASCSSLHRAERTEFLDVVGVGQHRSAPWSRVIGVTRDRACVELQSLVSAGSLAGSEPETDVDWIPLAELEPADVERVVALAREPAAVPRG
jgi:hypothetical protein